MSFTLPAPIPDVVEGILPAQEVSILAGASGAGKTFLVMHLIRCVQRGEPFFGHRILPGTSVGYIAADRTLRAAAYTIDRVGVDATTLPVRSVVDETSIDHNLIRSGKGEVLLAQLLDSLAPACSLIIVDPLVALFGGDPKSYHLMAPALISLNKWCNARERTILGIHHSTKARTDFTFKRPTDRINGSMALLGFSSSQLFLMEPEENGPACHQLHVRSHTAPECVINLKRVDGVFDPVPLVLDEITGQAPAPQADPTDDPVAQALLRAIPNGVAVSREFLLQAVKDVSAPTIDRRLRALVASGVLLRSAHGEYRR